MKKKLLIGAIVIALTGAFYAFNSTDATCTGSKNCSACKNCKYCGHCAKNGGSCGVCK
ncbi:hypothetical protein [Flavobacterium sp. UMI-01]|uniref:hypothetical protein n=1 Tax=Flavobacterium sp. UMI-01 TaxID=1441053 RepID=UPI001C7D578D|nr:hypothetical protein [Flavobacterium sp. UMI-01]